MENKLEKIKHIPIEIEVIFGNKTLKIDELLQIGIGSIIEFEKEINEPVLLSIQGNPFAKGEIVVVDDKLGVRVLEILKKE